MADPPADVEADPVGVAEEEVPVALTVEEFEKLTETNLTLIYPQKQLDSAWKGLPNAAAYIDNDFYVINTINSIVNVVRPL